MFSDSYRRSVIRLLIGVSVAVLSVAGAIHRSTPVQAQAAAIVAENGLAGTPQVVWDLPANAPGGDPNLQGFATDLSVNSGDTVHFKIANTTGVNFTIDIYRLGYYGGNGARKIATVTPTGAQLSAAAANFPQNCAVDNTTGLFDCGNRRTTSTASTDRRLARACTATARSATWATRIAVSRAARRSASTARTTHDP